MAFFKFRKATDEHATPAAAPESVEVMRKRARQRLIGATVLVLAGVIGFPLLLDKQPRPIAVDIPIEIPDRNKVKPLSATPVAEPVVNAASPASSVSPAATNAAPAATVSAPAAPATTPAPAAKVTAPAAATATPSAIASTPAPAPAASAVPAAKPVAKPDPKAESKPAAANGRFVVQVGAFSDAAKVREFRAKLSKAGLKTYTQVVQTPEGKRTRVRLGPFASRADAEKAVEKIKKLDLPATILEL